jgi:site-specific DNA-methyltransferase (adenine-specific)
VIDLAAWWEQAHRVAKPNAAIVCTGSQPFTSKLIMSNVRRFRYEWVWEKSNGTNFLSLEWQPFKVHENVIVFSSTEPVFMPQHERGKPYRAVAGKVFRAYLGEHEKGTTTINDGTRHPRTVLKFNQERGLHPTQKPVALFEYLIRTYTQPGDLVLDPFMGSGTTAVAAQRLGRNFTGCDISPEYVELARRRVRYRGDDKRMVKESEAGVEQLSLFESQPPNSP